MKYLDNAWGNMLEAAKLSAYAGVVISLLGFIFAGWLWLLVESATIALYIFAASVLDIRKKEKT